MAQNPAPRDRLPAWPLGCVLALLNLMLLFSLSGLVGVLAAGAGLPPALAVGVTLAFLVPAPLAELFGALWLRRRNPYAASALAWGLALTAALIGLFALYTSWLDRASGL